MGEIPRLWAKPSSSIIGIDVKSETLDGSIGAVLANFGKFEMSTALASVLAHICSP